MTLYTVEGINANTDKLLFKNYKNLPLDEQNSFENANILATIDIYTRRKERLIFTNLLKFVWKNTRINLDCIKYNKKYNQYEYNDGYNVITFDMISKHIDCKAYKRELDSSKRLGECHTGSLYLAPCLKNSLVVTGYIIFEDEKILHSVVEYSKNGIDYILDWTKNLIMLKKDYVDLTKFEPISAIEGEKVVNDMALILENLNISTKHYSVFREELMRDMKKNPQIFKITKKGDKFLEKMEKNKKR